MTIDKALDRYVDLLSGLSPDRLSELRDFLNAAARFRDPFNDVTGRDAFVRVFEKMFEDVEDVRFEVIDRAISDRTCYLRWDMSCRPKGGRRHFEFEGMSEIRFDPEGKVEAHLDHWDAGSQFYAKLPVLGFLVERVRRRLTAER